MTRMYLVRHGQSEGNDKRMFLGQIDLGLTSLGYRQAEAVGEYLSQKNIEAIYSSHLKRAMLTIKPLADKLSLDINKCESIAEIYAGHWQGLEYEEIGRRFPESYSQWMSDIGNSRCDGGESMQELQKRALAGFEKICRENDGKNIAVVSHGGCIRSAMCHFYGMHISEMKNTSWVANAAVSIINYESGKFSVEEANITSHLNGLESEFPSNI